MIFVSDCQDLKDELLGFRNDYAKLKTEVGKVVVGQDEIVEATLTALIAGGHVLLEGVPGLGKTLLVRTLADVLHSRFSRIQFTPDLMPADLIGTNVLLESAGGERQFEFQKGPIFSNVLLADEINRATPKTQSALLESMQEHAVTVAGKRYPLDGLFFVMATQNPLEMEGTYPLPEAQLDRFLFKLLVKFPTTEQIETILDRTTETEQPIASSVLDSQRVVAMSRLARQVPIADPIRRYGISLVMATHPDQSEASELTKRYVRYGSSPRGAQSLILASKIRAILDGRLNVAQEDVRNVAHNVLRHRLIMNFEGQAEGVQPDDVIDDILKHVTQSTSIAD